MEHLNEILLLLSYIAMMFVVVKCFTMDLPTYKAMRWQLGITVLALILIIAVFHVLKWATNTTT